jgi:hypothetical protein
MLIITDQNLRAQESCYTSHYMLQMKTAYAVGSLSETVRDRIVLSWKNNQTQCVMSMISTVP